MSTPSKGLSRSKLLARYLDGALNEKASVEAEIPRRHPEQLVEASEAQKQFWLHGQIAGSVPLYNEPVTIHFEGDLNSVAFEQAFNHIVSRHESWRTALRWSEGRLVQLIAAELTTSIPVLDLRREPQQERYRHAIELATRDALTPIDPSRLPLFRLLLVRLEHSYYRLHLTLHHLIFDGVSLYQIFLPELQSSYSAFSQGKASPLLPLKAQYADYCLWQSQDRRVAVWDAHMGYWDEQLKGELPVLNLPFDRPRPPVRDFRGGMETFTVSADVSAALKRAGELRQATSYMTILAAFHVLLYRLTGQAEQIIGTESSSRKHPSAEDMLGLFLNAVVLRTRFEPEIAFLDLVSGVRENVLDALSHEVPFSALVTRFATHRQPGVNPLFQVLFSLEPPLPPLAPNWKLTQMDVETGTSKFDLALEVDQREEFLMGRFLFASDVFDRSTIRRLTQEWTELLQVIARNPEQSIADLLKSLPESSSQTSVSKDRELRWPRTLWLKLSRK